MNQWFDIIINSTRPALEQLLAFIPRIIAALLLFILAYIIAKILQKVTTRIASTIGADRLADKAGISNFLRAGGFQKPLSWYVGRLFFWVLLLLFLLPISDILNLTFFADVIGSIVYFFPNLLIALAILIIGFWLARVIGGLAEGAATRIAAASAKVVGLAVRSLIILVTLIITLSQLNIAAEILSFIVMSFIATFGLAFALSTGFGSIDVVRNLLAGYYLQKQLKPEMPIQIGSIRGTIVGITPLFTILQGEGADNTIILPNSQFIQQSKESSK